MSELSQNVLSIAFLLLIVGSIGSFIWLGVIKSKYVATADQVRDAYFEGFDDGCYFNLTDVNSTDVNLAETHWNNSMALQNLTMGGHLDD